MSGSTHRERSKIEKDKYHLVSKVGSRGPGVLKYFYHYLQELEKNNRGFRIFCTCVNVWNVSIVTIPTPPLEYVAEKRDPTLL